MLCALAASLFYRWPRDLKGFGEVRIQRGRGRNGTLPLGQLLRAPVQRVLSSLGWCLLPWLVLRRVGTSAPGQLTLVPARRRIETDPRRAQATAVESLAAPCDTTNCPLAPFGRLKSHSRHVGPTQLSPFKRPGRGAGACWLLARFALDGLTAWELCCASPSLRGGGRSVQAELALLSH